MNNEIFVTFEDYSRILQKINTYNFTKHFFTLSLLFIKYWHMLLMENLTVPSAGNSHDLSINEALICTEIVQTKPQAKQISICVSLYLIIHGYDTPKFHEQNIRYDYIFIVLLQWVWEILSRLYDDCIPHIFQFKSVFYRIRISSTFVDLKIISLVCFQLIMDDSFPTHRTGIFAPTR